MNVSRTPGRSDSLPGAFQSSDACASALVCGNDVEEAQKFFEAWICRPPDEQNSNYNIIKKIVAVECQDKLLTESGAQPLNWPEVDQQIRESLQNDATDDFEQGYWVDMNQVLPPGNISPNLGVLERSVPEEIRSSLNWSPDKQFYFLVSALSRPLPPPGYFYANEISADKPELASGDPEPESEVPNLDGSVLALPELMDKETVALVQARNSIVATWLWRKHTLDARLAAKEVYVSSYCTLLLPE